MLNFLFDWYWNLLFLSLNRYIFNCIKLLTIFEIRNNSFSLFGQFLHQLCLLFTRKMTLCLILRFSLCCNLWGNFLNMFNYSEQFVFSTLVLSLLLLFYCGYFGKSKFLSMLDGGEQFFLGLFVLVLLSGLCDLGEGVSVILDFC